MGLVTANTSLHQRHAAVKNGNTRDWRASALLDSSQPTQAYTRDMQRLKMVTLRTGFPPTALHDSSQPTQAYTRDTQRLKMVTLGTLAIRLVGLCDSSCQTPAYTRDPQRLRRETLGNEGLYSSGLAHLTQVYSLH